MVEQNMAKSWTEYLADLDDPTSKDVDPEDITANGNDDAESSAEHENDPNGAREHYEVVGKSKLRNPNGIDLGPRYTGSHISRDDLNGYESDNDPFRTRSGDEASEDGGSEGEEDNQGRSEDDWDDDGGGESDADIMDEGESLKQDGAPKHQRKGKPIGDRDDEMSESLESHSDDDEDAPSEELQIRHDILSTDGDSDTSSISSPAPEPQDSRAAIRKMMAEEQTTVAAHLSGTARADLAKGRAIKNQRNTFDALLNTRIKLQKALTASNTLPPPASPSSTTDPKETVQAAETAALNLWNDLNALRSSLHPDTPKSFSGTSSTPSWHLWEEMQSQETHSHPLRRTTLNKWSLKTNPAPIQRRDKFLLTPTQQPITAVLDSHLSGSGLEKMLTRAKGVRDRAPVPPTPAAGGGGGVYDDADFYTLMLRELVERRTHDTALHSTANTNILPAMPDKRDFKARKQVDRKASKGRKMRYQVHEKLVAFMAAEDKGSWGEGRRGELFGGLLGQKVDMGEGGEGEEGDGMDVDGGSDEGKDDTDGNGENGALRLFS